MEGKILFSIFFVENFFKETEEFFMTENKLYKLFMLMRVIVINSDLEMSELQRDLNLVRDITIFLFNWALFKNTTVASFLIVLRRSC